MKSSSTRQILIVGLLLLIGGGAAYAMDNTTTSARSWIGCVSLFMAPLLGIAVLVHKDETARYMDEAIVEFGPQQVRKWIDRLFEENPSAGRPWRRKIDDANPQLLILEAHMLPYWGGCVLTVLLGIIEGVVLFLFLGRRQKIQIWMHPAPDDSRTKVYVTGTGIVGVRDARKFIVSLKTIAPTMGL